MPEKPGATQKATKQSGEASSVEFKKWKSLGFFKKKMLLKIW